MLCGIAFFRRIIRESIVTIVILRRYCSYYGMRPSVGGLVTLIVIELVLGDALVFIAILSLKNYRRGSATARHYRPDTGDDHAPAARVNLVAGHLD